LTLFMKPMSNSKRPMGLPILAAESLLPGDTVLCYSRLMEAEHFEMAGYSHVAICLGDGDVLQADVDGVTACPTSSLLESYDHLAVLRNRETWGEDEVEKLRTFAKASVGKPFNQMGVGRLPGRQEAHKEKVMESISAYFIDGSVPIRSKASYFCSQLIAEALVVAGVIDEPASIVLDPLVTSPRGISLDAIYGRFIGYIVRPGYQVPGDDRFRSQ
jgi:Permuted papain-like amidase enzyme, YaeF/YiiX, C92 family